MDHREVQRPNPLYMLLKNMRQGEWRPDTPYAGILGASEEMVFATAKNREDAIDQAQAWINEGGTYREGDVGTFIEIHEFASLTKGDETPTEIIYYAAHLGCGDSYHYDRYGT